MKNLLLILLATLFVACNEGTRYDEPEVPKTRIVETFARIENVQWELSDRWQPVGGGHYALEPTYVSVVHIEKTELAGDSIDLSESEVWFSSPQTGYGGYYDTVFTYEETSSEIILNVECPIEIGNKPTEEPSPFIILKYSYYTTY